MNSGILSMLLISVSYGIYDTKKRKKYEQYKRKGNESARAAVSPIDFLIK